MRIHGEPPPWRKKVKFVGPRLDFEGSLYDDYGLIEPPLNFNLDDEIAQRTEELIRDMYERTLSLLQRHHAALLKTIKVIVPLVTLIKFFSNCYLDSTEGKKVSNFLGLIFLGSVYYVLFYGLQCRFFLIRRKSVVKKLTSSWTSTLHKHLLVFFLRKMIQGAFRSSDKMIVAKLNTPS